VAAVLRDRNEMAAIIDSISKFEVGRSFGARGQWVLGARWEVPLRSSSDEYTVTNSRTYTFQ
jgi:hypothetical protein